MWVNLQKDILEEFTAFSRTYYTFADLGDCRGWQYGALLGPAYSTPPRHDKRVRVNGVDYDSQTQAATALGWSKDKIRLAIQRGDAVRI